MRLNFGSTAALAAFATAALCAPGAEAAKKKFTFKKHNLFDDERYPKQPGPNSCQVEDISIAFTFDATLNFVSPDTFPPTRTAAAEFIRAVTDNHNMFASNFFNIGLFASAGPGDNKDDAIAAFTEEEDLDFEYNDPPNIVVGLEAAALALSGLPNPVIVLISDGFSPPADPDPTAAALRDAGITIIGIEVGGFLGDIVTTSPDGEALILNEDLSAADLEALVIAEVVKRIDTDGDGTPDCEDGCPTDPKKLDPGFCGCGYPDTFPCPGDLDKKKLSKKSKSPVSYSKKSMVTLLKGVKYGAGKKDNKLRKGKKNL